ncbi:hypothetical protein [Kineosporia sp. NBRC 101731]|uniref:hypothetical protein n=1 Tax=Kineosporia sp. NBRC 101731 TaxID=3032199 RepID=UPI00249FA5D7|nr:hypothetical protein [Kineosporia sp. NBRC 101731]GLY32999.1 hypothetical protein Kisp02_63640 [Kineosporia sp. NBRC 101731]
MTVNSPLDLVPDQMPPSEYGGRRDHDDSLVQQLTALYHEKQELHHALGVSSASEVIDLFHAAQRQDMLKSLGEQLFSLYGEREELEKGLGTSASNEIVDLVTSLRATIRSLVDDSRRRLAYETTVLDSYERYL